jgi:MHS family alpha-ketoglutarate permease-like MFS transporter
MAIVRHTSTNSETMTAVEVIEAMEATRSKEANEAIETLSASNVKPPQLRSIIGGLGGNLIEWYDFLTYSIFSIYFAKSFFPSDKPTVQLMNTAAIAAVGYVARPLGSWIVGLWADKRGRKSALTWSVSAMCIGSLIIAVTPGYHSIGIFAPITLLIARLIQGLSMGGEYGTSATYLTEIAPPNRRGFFVGFLQVSVIAGQLLALGVMIVMQQMMTSHQIEAWGWRIPFLIGALLALFALYMRRNVSESDAFRKAQKESGPSVVAQLLQHWKQILLAIGMTVGGTVGFYTYTIYMQKYLVNTVGLSKEASTLASTAALFIYMLFQPLFGYLSDIVGRRPVLICFGLTTTLFSVPLFNQLSVTRDPLIAFALAFLGLLMLAGFTSVHMLAKAEMFPVRIRALAVGFPYALTTAILGGTTEFVALKFKAIGHEHYFYWYVSGCAAVSLMVYIFMPETNGLAAKKK